MNRWRAFVYLGLLALIATDAQDGFSEPSAAQEKAPAAAASAENAAPTPASAPAHAQPEKVRVAIQNYITDVIEEEGGFFMDDERTGQVRELSLLEVLPDVKQQGTLDIGLARMKDVDSNETVDLEFDTELYDQDIDIVDVRVTGSTPAVSATDAAPVAPAEPSH